MRAKAFGLSSGTWRGSPYSVELQTQMRRFALEASQKHRARFGMCCASTPGMRNMAEEQVNMGRAWMQSGDNLEAIQCMARAIKLEPEYFAAYRWLGILQQRLGDPHAAKAWYLLSLGCSSVSRDVYVDLGGVCMELGQQEEAVGYLLCALDTASLDWAEYQAVGIALSRLGQPVRAIEALTRSIAIHPDAETWSQLGFCHFLQCDLAAAESSYRLALQYDPEHAAAHTNLGLTLLAQCRYGEGFREYDWRLKIQGRTYYHFEGFEAPLWKRRNQTSCEGVARVLSG